MTGGGVQSVRSLAAEAGKTVAEVLQVLQAFGIKVSVGGQRLQGGLLSQARAVLALHDGERPPPAVTRLGESQILIQIMRPLLNKGKLGPTRTTPIDHLFGHGVPDHQKDEARTLTERLLREGLLREKTSQGRRHIWLTNEGQAALEKAEGKVRQEISAE